jgi:ribonucleoside-diphosphate reductase alpha chain
VYPVESFYGNVQVTITELDNYPGRPWDIRLQIGKGGNDTNAHVEALGRTISVALRTGVDVVALVDQLLDIGGHSSVGFGPQKVRSVADGVAKLLRRLYMQGERIAPGWPTNVEAIPSVTEHVSVTSWGPVQTGFMATANAYSSGTTLASSNGASATVATLPVASDVCPHCNLATVVMESGCRHCDMRLGGCGTFSGCD